MKTYTIAVDLHSLETNQGTEIIASSITEALDKYESMAGRSYTRGDGTATVKVRMPDGEIIGGFVAPKPTYRSREGELL